MNYIGAPTSDKWTWGDGRRANPAHSGKLVSDVPAEPRPAPLTPQPPEQRALHYLSTAVSLYTSEQDMGLRV